MNRSKGEGRKEYVVLFCFFVRQKDREEEEGRSREIENIYKYANIFLLYYNLMFKC